MNGKVAKRLRREVFGQPGYQYRSKTYDYYKMGFGENPNLTCWLSSWHRRYKQAKSLFKRSRATHQGYGMLGLSSPRGVLIVAPEVYEEMRMKAAKRKHDEARNSAL